MIEHAAHRVDGKIARMLAPRPQSLLGDRGDQLAVDHEAGCGIGVKGVEAENGCHVRTDPYAPRYRKGASAGEPTVNADTTKTHVDPPPMPLRWQPWSGP